MASIISASTTSATALNLSGDTTGVLQIATGATPTTAVTVDASQNVGINATDMSASGKNAKLAVVGNINLDDDNFIAWGGGTGRPTFAGNKASNYMYWSISGTERMRIDSVGVGIGTTNTSSGSVSNGVTIFAGRFSTVSGNGSIANGGTLNLFTIPSASTYIVTIQTGNASGLSAVAIMSYPAGGNPVTKASLLQDNVNFTITFSGTTIRATNSLGGPIVCDWHAMRLY